MKKPDFEDVVGIFMIAIAVLFATVLCVAFANAQDLDEASNLHLIAEMAQRGIDRFGCWTERRVVAQWDGVDDALWYDLRISGAGTVFDIDRVYHYVTADTLEMWWPAGCDTLDAQVRGVNLHGAGPWSAPSEQLILN